MKKRIEVFLVILITNILTFAATDIYNAFAPDHEVFPENVIFSVPNPSGNTIAIIMRENSRAMFAGERYYLALKKGESTYLIMREINKGQGDYESGVVGVKWINTTEILIERVLYAQRKDLIFNIEKHKWTDVVSTEKQAKQL